MAKTDPIEYIVTLSDEDRDLLRQIRDRLPAPATENDYQAVTTPRRLTEEQGLPPSIREDKYK